MKTLECLLFLGATCAVSACGGSTGEGPGAGKGGVSIQKYLDANCAWSAACGQGTPQPCSPKAPYQARPIFRPEIIDEMAACQATLACTKRDDVCGDNIIMREVNSATGVRKQTVTDCATALDGCSFKSVDCIGLAIVEDAELAPFDRCFAASNCSMVSSCLSALGFPVQLP